MHEIGMDPGAVKGIAVQIGNHHVNIQETLSALRNLNGQLETSWSGTAKTEFEATYGNWITQLQNYSETLANVKGYLESVAANFEELNEAARAAAAGATQG